MLYSCVCVKFSLQVFTYRCVCMVCFFLFHSLGVKFVFCWWVRARMCVVCVWVVSGISFYLFGIASHELKTINDSDKRWNSKKKTWSELNWRNEKWIYVNKRFLVATATAAAVAVAGCFCCCCWFCTHTHNVRPSLWSMWTMNSRNNFFVNKLHTAIIEWSRKSTQTNTHTLRILCLTISRFFNFQTQSFTKFSSSVFSLVLSLAVCRWATSLFPNDVHHN